MDEENLTDAQSLEALRATLKVTNRHLDRIDRRSSRARNGAVAVAVMLVVLLFGWRFDAVRRCESGNDFRAAVVEESNRGWRTVAEFTGNADLIEPFIAELAEARGDAFDERECSWVPW